MLDDTALGIIAQLENAFKTLKEIDIVTVVLIDKDGFTEVIDLREQ